MGSDICKRVALTDFFFILISISRSHVLKNLWRLIEWHLKSNEYADNQFDVHIIKV